MDDPLVVRGGQAVGNGGCDLSRLFPWQRTGAQPAPQRLAFQKLGGEEDDPAGFVAIELVESDDVRMGQRGDRFRLPLKTDQRLLVGGQLLRKDLDRHFTPETIVPRLVDLSHSARADGIEDLEMAKTSAGSERHVEWLVWHSGGMAAALQIRST